MSYYERFVISYENYAMNVRNILKPYFTVRQFYKELEKLKDLKKIVRDNMQMLANIFYSENRMRHYPVYLSDKYKITRGGLAFRKKEGRPLGAVVFYLRALGYIPPDNKIGTILKVAPSDEVFKFLVHELNHLLDYEKLGFTEHGAKFEKRVQKTIIDLKRV